MQSPPTSDNGADSFDPSRPFRGLVLCCTDIEADLRSKIAQRTSDMGGIHTYDLTPDVTHLIVGKYNTAKYRHVARERPDIKPMAAAWVEAVRRLWVEDRDIDMAALEHSWGLQTFESGGGIPNSPSPPERERQRLVCCLTGFEDNNVRAMIEDTVRVNGGEYVADLSRRVTHLIVARPEGKKYNAACRWGIYCVSIEWLHDSVERGMILNEDCYHPALPPEERGKGAWVPRDHQRVALGKRAREESVASAEVGRRKLRKSASLRMNDQRNNIWGDILNQSAGDLSRSDDVQRESSAPAAFAPADPVTSAINANPVPQPPSDGNWPALRKGVFSGCRFFVHGFPEQKEQVLFNFLTSHGGQLCSSVQDTASLSHAEPLNQRYLLVSQTSQPDSHPKLPDGVHIITEFFIERCVHNKTLFNPMDHVWGQPFPRFPIDGFQNLTICTAGFVNEQLNQIEKTVIQLGATYSERLNRQVSLLICEGLASLREQKRDLAIYHNITIVDVEWLWQCITTGCLVPWDKFQFDELVLNIDSIRATLKRKEEDKKRAMETLNGFRSEPVLTKPSATRCGHQALAPPLSAGVDVTAFDSDMPGANRETPCLPKQERYESHYEVAPTHPRTCDNTPTAVPLSEITASVLNKPASLPEQHQPDRALTRFPTEGEVGDSEAGEESDATTRTTPKESFCDADIERRRKAQQAKDRERMELSKRLNSLMADGASQDGNAPRPGRRKRQILGRAASNVSAASSASADSSSTLSGLKMRHLSSVPIVGSASRGSEFDKFLESDGDGVGENDTLPPSTQLEYEDPQATKHRQVVMGKILGRDKQASKRGADDGTGGQKQEQSGEKIQTLNSEVTRRTTRRHGRG